ncbi:MAG: hypothetical protein HMLKMBBP_03072 [Planctomycetes bacterium]|nr:hypothetical protein [Planctomycetota bacterium]
MTGRRASGGPMKLSEAKWTKVTVKPQGSVTGMAGTHVPLTEVEYLRSLFGIRDADKAPVLVYFHYAHEDVKEPEGEAEVSAAACKVVNEEFSVRWELLFKCVFIHADKSDEKLMKRLGLGDGTSFAVLEPAALSVAAKSEEFPSEAKFTSFAKKTLSAKFPDFWEDVTKTLAEQEKAMAEAKALEKKDKLEDARDLYKSVYLSDVRIGSFWQASYEGFDRMREEIKRREK